MTSEQWDVHWYRIYRDARERPGLGLEAAVEIANGETVEQFGPRPEEAL